MEENKYYVPKIEEFHVGFECEYFDECLWKKEICDIDTISIASSVEEHGTEE